MGTLTCMITPLLLLSLSVEVERQELNLGRHIAELKRDCSSNGDAIIHAPLNVPQEIDMHERLNALRQRINKLNKDAKNRKNATDRLKELKERSKNRRVKEGPKDLRITGVD
jgi:predicted RNase H-like nuclease (RuvC/YqgF family)